MRFLARMVLNGLAIVIAAWIVPGLQLTGVVPALVAGAILGVVNALVRPVLLILTLPLTLVTLGFFIFVINALCLGLTAAIVPGFEISGFWAAFFGALLVSIVSWILNGVFASDLPAEERWRER
jgi:putative membrane protein